MKNDKPINPQPGQWWQDTKGMFRFQPYRILANNGDTLRIDYFPNDGQLWYNTKNVNAPRAWLTSAEAEYVGESEPNPWHAWFGWTGLTYPYRVAKKHSSLNAELRDRHDSATPPKQTNSPL